MDKINCSIFHDMDGQCCGNENCAVAVTRRAATPPPVFLFSTKDMFWAMLVGCAVFVFGAVTLNAHDAHQAKINQENIRSVK